MATPWWASYRLDGARAVLQTRRKKPESETTPESSVKSKEASRKPSVDAGSEHVVDNLDISDSTSLRRRETKKSGKTVRTRSLSDGRATTASKAASLSERHQQSEEGMFEQWPVGQQTEIGDKDTLLKRKQMVEVEDEELRRRRPHAEVENAGSCRRTRQQQEVTEDKGTRYNKGRRAPMAQVEDTGD